MFELQNEHKMLNKLPPIGEIKAYFPKHRICVVKNMLLLLKTILESRTVNLNKCKSKVGASIGQKDLNLSSVYTRFIRFFKMKKADAFCLSITFFILGILHLSGVVYLVIDRTNWEIGQKKINVLCLGLLLPNGVFIPILWETLPKKGNSNTKERISLLTRLQIAWPSSKKYQFILLGDREFIGLDWFCWMLDQQLGFVVRLRWQDYFILAAMTNNITVSKFEKKIARKVKKNGFFQCKLKVKDHILYLTVFANSAKRRVKKKPNPGDDYVVLCSPMKDIQQISQSYRKRWGIEVFFRHIKENGINLEDLNLKIQEKVQIMMGIAAIAYCISIIEGLRLENLKPIKIKKHGSKEVSYFRKGFDNLQNTVHQLIDLIQFILKILKPLKLLDCDLKSV
jgi:Transposase DDE domain